MKKRLPGLALIGSFLVCLLISFCGCDDDEAAPKPKPVTLAVSVDIAALSSQEKHLIDRVEIVAVGLAEPIVITKPKAAAFVADRFTISTDPLVVPYPLRLIARASVYAGDFEVAGQTQSVSLTQESGATALSFSLTSPVSPNGCRLVQSATPVGLPSDSNVYTFDVTSDAGGGFMLAYSDLAKTDGDIFTVKLDAQGKAAGAPRRITNYDSRSIFPSITKLADGYLLGWQNSGPLYEFFNMQLGKLNSAGELLGGSLLFQASAKEVLVASVVEPSTGHVAIAWHDGLSYSDRVGVALGDLPSNNSVGLVGLQPYRGLGSKHTKHIALASAVAFTGFAAVWSDTVTPNNEGIRYNLNYARLDSSLNITQLVSVRDNFVGESTNAHIVGTYAGFIISWEDTRSGVSEIYTSAISPLGAKLNERKLTEPNATAGAFQPRLAWNPELDSTAMVYAQNRNADLGGRQIFLTRIDNSGNAVGLGDLQISKTLDTDGATPRVVATADGFMVFWAENKLGASSRLLVARVVCD